MEKKLENLKEYIRNKKSLAIAFSGGVDSTFLLKIAHDILGDKCIAITGQSHSFPEREYKETIEFCKKEKIKHIVFESGEIDNEEYAKNPRNRCYICKHTLFSKMIEIAKGNNIKYVCEGSNMDDLGDYRPGLQAVEELGILSPLRQANLYKSEIRTFSKEMGLETWDKQAFACLASRFVYGERITIEKLQMVEKAENILGQMGFRQYRVRIHGMDARIEVSKNELGKIMQEENRLIIIDKLKEFGFGHISLDLEGYRQGSMNI